MYIKKPTLVMLGDNEGSNRLCRLALMTQQNQHMYLPYFFVREQYMRRQLFVGKVHTKYNLADLLTKATSRQTCSLLIPLITGYEDYRYIVDQIMESLQNDEIFGPYDPKPYSVLEDTGFDDDGIL